MKMMQLGMDDMIGVKKENTANRMFEDKMMLTLTNGRESSSV